jgi:hypothetical protein
MNCFSAASLAASAATDGSPKPRMVNPFLEHDVTRLKDELRRIRMSAGTADAGFEPGAPARET